MVFALAQHAVDGTRIHFHSDRPLPFQDVIRYGLQTTEALAHAAKFDIVHGDIKPSNVLLVDVATVKISDFGLASRLSEATATPAAVAGTLDYMPPEAIEGRGTDFRGDMYSLGVTLFEMTFGRLPYDTSSGDLSERLRLQRETAVEFPASWPRGLPPTWRGVLATLLDRNPEGRYADFGDLMRDLKKHQPITLPPASPLLRGLAWLFDGFLLLSPLFIISLIFAAERRTLISLMRTATEAVIVSGMCLLQARWGTTPEKRLFQVRIVDQHGLTPGRSVLASRAALQFLWAGTMVLDHFTRLLGLAYVGQAATVVALVFILAEMSFVVFGKGHSLHDRILGTQVVLDANTAQSPG